MSNLTACVACNPEEITNNGSCQACPEGQVPNANQTVCEVPEGKYLHKSGIRSPCINVVMFLKSRLRSINNQVSKNKKDQEMVFCYQNCSNDREKLLKFEAEGQEFAKFLRSLKQFIQTMKGQNSFW